MGAPWRVSHYAQNMTYHIFRGIPLYRKTFWQSDKQTKIQNIEPFFQKDLRLVFFYPIPILILLLIIRLETLSYVELNTPYM